MSLGYWETLASLVGTPTAITAAARTSMTVGATGARFTMPGGKLKLGDVIHVAASGRISSVITTPGTARFDLAFGTSLGTAIMDSLAILLDTVAAHTNVGWKLFMEGTVQAVGTAANMSWDGQWICEDILGVPATAPKGVLTAMLPWNTNPAVSANFDSTIANLIDLNFTQTVATGSIQLTQYTLSHKTSTGF